MNKNQICKGCLAFENDRCFIKRARHIEKCPCRNCLIKGICKEICDDFSEFMDNTDITMELNQKQICRGCLVFESDRCFIRRANRIEKCPCRNCLIKGICRKICTDFKEFIDSIGLDATSRTDYE